MLFDGENQLEQKNFQSDSKTAMYVHNYTLYIAYLYLIVMETRNLVIPCLTYNYQEINLKLIVKKIKKTGLIFGFLYFDILMRNFII